MEKKKKDETAPGEMTFLEHLEELRKRVIHILIMIIAGFVVCYIFSEQLFHFLVNPVLSALPQDKKLVFTSPYQPFAIYIKVAMIMGCFFTFPGILYETWKFVAPGLYKNERRYTLLFLTMTIVFFVGGALFGYSMVLPYCYKFLIGYGSDFTPMLTINDALSSVTWLLFAFGMAFELPVVILILAKMGIVSLETLKKGRSYIILLIFVFAAIITPTPDLVTQTAVAIPMYLLYELSIILIKLFIRK
ncbi:MAG: twin-arginine translocase subunit TatC [Candidatus Schekmanbacteria bacterium]|nr:twin-arginine translocase subunit TatC [Candidatus Schekmanbacteria bacterium]